jgi:hypothetical protein
MKLMITREANIEQKKELAKAIVGIKEDKYFQSIVGMGEQEYFQKLKDKEV